MARVTALNVFPRSASTGECEGCLDDSWDGAMVTSLSSDRGEPGLRQLTIPLPDERIKGGLGGEAEIMPSEVLKSSPFFGG
jgi:hypothetical protein